MKPQGKFVMGFGILPGIPRHLVDEPLKNLNMASVGATLLGGKKVSIRLDQFRPEPAEIALWRRVAQSRGTQEEVRPAGNPQFGIHSFLVNLRT